MAEIDEIIAFEFRCTPWDRNYPIKEMKVLIYAKSRKEAELIKLAHDYKFFNQDLFVEVKELGVGYRESRTTQKTNPPRE